MSSNLDDVVRRALDSGHELRQRDELGQKQHLTDEERDLALSEERGRELILKLKELEEERGTGLEVTVTPQTNRLIINTNVKVIPDPDPDGEQISYGSIVVEKDHISVYMGATHLPADIPLNESARALFQVVQTATRQGLIR